MCLVSLKRNSEPGSRPPPSIFGTRRWQITHFRASRSWSLTRSRSTGSKKLTIRLTTSDAVLACSVLITSGRWPPR